MRLPWARPSKPLPSAKNLYISEDMVTPRREGEQKTSKNIFIIRLSFLWEDAMQNIQQRFKALNIVIIFKLLSNSLCTIIAFLGIPDSKFFSSNIAILFISIQLILTFYILTDVNYKSLSSRIELLTRYFSRHIMINGFSMSIHKVNNDGSYIRFTNTIKNFRIINDRGEKFEAKKGIVGEAICVKNSEISANLKTGDEKIEKLTKVYRYSEKEAVEQNKNDKQSYYCRSILYKDKLWGVIFMASTELYAFSNEKEQINCMFRESVNHLLEEIDSEIESEIGKKR